MATLSWRHHGKANAEHDFLSVPPIKSTPTFATAGLAHRLT
jgi:hypothetical protein